MPHETIADLFAKDISRHIEEVIKVDQTDEQVIREELSEYVVTDSIRAQFTEVFEKYWETPKKPHEGVGVWVSGFFGSGKSSFAKYLGLALANRSIAGAGAAALLAQRAGDQKVEVLLRNISEQIPTEAVIFDVSTDRGIRTGNQTLTEIMYRLFLQSLGYARDLDLSELEITLEDEGRLEAFKARYQELFAREWDREKGKIAVAVQQASRVMNALEPATYPTVDSWRESAMRRADINPGELAKRCLELMQRRRPGKVLVFVVDEVGQFVARDVQKMLDLQAVVQNLGRVGRGRLWVVVTSQEKLTELVGGLDDKRVELARLMDRFPSETQVHLEPADISEVTSKRVLSKNAAAEQRLRGLFTEHRGRLTDHTRLTADIKLPELSTEAFIDLYPLLPYQIDLIIQVVSGLRTQGGASRHVGGANRTIIKLAQQLLVHPDVALAAAPVGTLARIDQMYDLVSGNIASEVRGKIHDIGREVGHPLAQAVAKAICLLQYVRSIHRSPENIAAALHPAVDADSRLPEVRSALAALEKAQMVRLGDDGYRIPTPAEDDWERQRAALAPKPGDVSRLHSEVVDGLWTPQPSHSFLDVKPFKAGLYLNDRLVREGDIPFHLTLAEAGTEYERAVAEARARSQRERRALFWVAALDGAIDRETVGAFRSREILSRKERSAQTRDETALVAEEKVRLRRHLEELKRLLKQSLLSGAIFFRGNDRSPEDTAVDVGKTAARALGQALPDVFDRFREAAARVDKKDLDALLTIESLRGLTPVFTTLKLVHEQGGKPAFDTDGGPLAEVLARITNRTSYGELASGKYLEEELGKEPFGWDFDVVRLLAVALLRAGKVEVTSKGQVIESALSLEARNTFPNNNHFRGASFRPKVGIDFTQLVEAAEAFKTVFGKELPNLVQSSVAAAVREEVQRHEAALQEAHNILVKHDLPGADVLKAALDQMRAIRTGNEERAIQTFTGAHKELKEAIKRGAELEQALTAPRLQDLARARRALDVLWPAIEGEPDLTEAERGHAKTLADLTAKERFFQELPAIDQHARVIEEAHRRRRDQALNERLGAYERALEQLRGTPGWDQLDAEQQTRVAEPLAVYAVAEKAGAAPIVQLRAERDACHARRDVAIETLVRMVDGQRVASVRAAEYFQGGIDTEEQLDAALSGLRDQCVELIAAGKKVLVQ